MSKRRWSHTAMLSLVQTWMALRTLGLEDNPDRECGAPPERSRDLGGDHWCCSHCGFWQNPPDSQRTSPALSFDERVRAIVREELIAAGLIRGTEGPDWAGER